ncbi:hypothetical protein BO78DRAFT_408276 [Aspergillus sclerotiicarbonarius CBS 121057]|uniref:Uncharacterized protein n=1 Tax=Aspergillus sclerotiicarbonarius (strain CBS 121057 / IBT 28362) TaxID=1448318 RepID=A0A319ENX2_ASPSB|nr:hypothetical protein BO78DRAFT_408276 [Aspergillus sclerotiicarbonarius CBS 121057]
MLSRTDQSNPMRRGFRSRYSHGTENPSIPSREWKRVSGQLQPKSNSPDLGVNQGPWLVGCTVPRSVSAMADVQKRHPIILTEGSRQMKINPAPERGRMRDYSSAGVGDQLKRIGPE